MSDQATTPSNEPTNLTAEEAQSAWDAEIADRNGEAPDTSAASTSGDATPAQATEDASAAAAAAATPAAATPDPLAVLLEKVERLSGKVSALQSATDKAKAAGAATPTKAQQEAALEDPAEWKQLLEDFPEWGTAVGKKIDASIAQLKAAQQPQQLPDVSAIVNAELVKRETARVDRLHPGWRDTVKSQEFKGWFSAQTPEIQALYESDYFEDADKMLRLFKESKASTTASNITARRAATQQAAAVTGKTQQPKGAQSAAGNETPEELWEQEAKRRERKRAA